MTTACTLAITGWQIVGFIALGAGLAVAVLWFWFVFLGKGDWS